ncbi:hypothetical protein [Spirosoma radiotolerans]|uniref:Uncharacterized protein n=1 Tax=Spirosoma radiotolerans TaxID=1379870 RepID=A0A0E3ZV30_9BACT|nr:hypothetical protein [Spirosoma radiotolerans]AKD54799.1 hypothetical protein SD10_07650 [Spirosoma radiotolerans]
MNVDQFNRLTISEQVVLIPLKGRFVAERQFKNQLVKLYHWGNIFLEIYYRWPASRRKGANWEPFRVNSFADRTGCSGQLLPYVDHINLENIRP